MRLLISLLSSLTMVLANSNGDGAIICNVKDNWGCERFADRNNRNRNTKGACCNEEGGPSVNSGEERMENKCSNRCCDKPDRIGHMFWVEKPIDFGDLYAIRTSNSANPADDPNMYYPGEIQHLYVKVLKRDAKFTGLLMNAIAVEHNNMKVGEWVFPKGDSVPLYWSSPACPDSAIQNSAEEKPYTSMLRWRAPKDIDGKPVGKIQFQTLLKRGGANGGKFYWNDLELDMGTRQAAAATDITWVQGNTGEKCSDACKRSGMECWPEAMSEIDSAQDLSIIERGVGCGLPMLSGCSTSFVPKVSDDDRCFYKDADCEVGIGCNLLPKTGSSLCGCGTAEGYTAKYPSGKGINSNLVDAVCVTCDELKCEDGCSGTCEITENNCEVCGEAICIPSVEGTTDTGITGGSGASERQASGTSKLFVHPILLLLLGVFASGTAWQKKYMGMVGLLLLLVAFPMADAHNWAHSEFRARKKAQSAKPCPPRVPGRVGVQVGPGQEFTVAWATGHGMSAHMLLVKGDQLSKIGRDAVSIAEKYMAAGKPEHSRMEPKWRRQHGSRHKDKPHTKDADKYMTPIAREDELFHISKIVDEENAAANPTCNDMNEFGKIKACNGDKMCIGAIYSTASTTQRCKSCIMMHAEKAGEKCAPEHSVFTYKIADERTNNDRRFEYFNEEMPHILMGAEFHVSEVNFGEFDQIRLKFPDWAEPGHYVLTWDWKGYGDCVDIELRTKEVANIYGTGSGGYTYDRVEHCTIAKHDGVTNDARERQITDPGLVSVCRRANPSIEQCIADIEMHNKKGGNFDLIRMGIQVEPIVTSDSINPLFTRADGASPDAPWDEERCLAGGVLDLAGTTTNSNDATWKTEWETRLKETQNDKACGKNYFFESRDLKTAVQNCNRKCDTVSVDAGVYKTCDNRGLVDKPGAKAFIKKDEYKQNDYSTIQGADFSSHLITVSFQPESSNFDLPEKHIKDTGETFSNKNGFGYGWTQCKHLKFREDAANVNDTFAWWPSFLCPIAPQHTELCAEASKALSNKYSLKFPDECKRNTWEIQVPNGWYKTVVTMKFSGQNPSPANSNVPNVPRERACAIEGTAYARNGVNYVQVVDGRITYEDAAGWFTCCYIYTCFGINKMEIYEMTGNTQTAPTWFPAEDGPWQQREFAAPRKIGIVSFETFDDECTHSWMAQNGPAKCIKEQRSAGYMKDIVVGVSKSSCADGGCMKDAQICSETLKGRNEEKTMEGWVHGGQPDAGHKNRFWTDCKGKEGKFAFLFLKGSKRILAVKELFFNQAGGPLAGDPNEFKDKFICYAMQARVASEHTPEFVTTDDPGDPNFYGTCFMREREVVYLPPESAEQSKPVAQYEFNGQCLSCDLYTKNRSPAPYVPNEWNWAEKCKICKG